MINRSYYSHSFFYPWSQLCGSNTFVTPQSRVKIARALQLCMQECRSMEQGVDPELQSSLFALNKSNLPPPPLPPPHTHTFLTRTVGHFLFSASQALFECILTTRIIILIILIIITKIYGAPHLPSCTKCVFLNICLLAQGLFLAPVISH